MAEDGLEAVLGVSKRLGLFGAQQSGWPCSSVTWLGGQLDTVLCLAHRPAASSSVAGEAAADVIATGAEEGLAVPLAQLSALEQLDRLGGQVEEADQVGD